MGTKIPLSTIGVSRVPPRLHPKPSLGRQAFPNLSLLALTKPHGFASGTVKRDIHITYSQSLRVQLGVKKLCVTRVPSFFFYISLAVELNQGSLDALADGRLQ